MDIIGIYDHVNILHLKGIFLTEIDNSDEDNNDIDNNDEDNDENDNDEIDNYKKYELVFTTKNNWVKKTKFDCYECNTAVNIVPFVLPLSLNYHEKYIYEFDLLRGYFCSWTCVHKNINNDYNKLELVNTLKTLW